MKSKTSYLIGACSILLLFSHSSFAQGSPAGGSNMWTGAMAIGNLFTPHIDNCDPITETFVPVVAGFLGYCIEKDQRSPQSWVNARHSCLQEFKRLPEVGEWIYACQNTTDLENMLGGWEWSTNAFIGGNPDLQHHSTVTILGFEVCTSARPGRVASQTGTADSFAFRCVR